MGQPKSLGSDLVQETCLQCKRAMRDGIEVQQLRDRKSLGLFCDIDCLMGHAGSVVWAFREGKASAGGAITAACEEVRTLLLAKNAAYGNSALEPVRIFSHADPTEQLRVRIDDKLSRLVKGDANAVTEDTVLDLIGYLILLRIAMAEEDADAANA